MRSQVTTGAPTCCAVSYQDHADARDCLGNQPQGSLAGVRVDSRFSVVSGELRCLGSNAATGAQVLIDGVEDFQVLYGVRSGTTDDARWQYLDARSGRHALVRRACRQHLPAGHRRRAP